MKFIHTADLHLNSRIDSLPSDKAKIRRDEIMRTFERLCEYAKTHNVTAVILAGDVFDTVNNTHKVKNRFLSAIKNASSVDFLFMNGNHDEGKVFDDDDVIPENLKFFGDDWTSFQYDNVVIKGLNFTAQNNTLIYDSLSNDAEKINVVVLHGQVAAYSSGDGYYVVSLPKLKDKFIDYLALGHVHSKSLSRLDNRGLFAYCGTPDGRGFDELGDKGFYLLETDNNSVKTYFIKFSSRNLYEYTFNVEEFNDFYTLKADIIKKISSEANPTSLIKVILKGERKIDFDLDVDSLTSQLNEHFFYAKVYDKTELMINENDFALDKTVRGEFIRKVLSSDIEDDKKKKIITCGLNALKGEELL